MKRGMMDRRTLLRGGAGIALALPALEIFESSNVRAQATSDPLRLLVIFHGNGVNQRDWYPSSTGTSYQMTESLLPLADFRDRMIVTSGLSGRSAKAQGGNPHTKGGAHLLTGSPHIDGQFSKGGGGGFSTSISFDQEVVRLIGAGTPIPSLVMGPKADEGAVGETPRSRISYLGHNQPVTPEHRPSVLFDQIVGVVPESPDPNTGMGPTAEDLRLIREQRRSVLDFVMDDVSRLQTRLGATDRSRLEEYLVQLREIEATIADDEAGGDGEGGTPRLCERPEPLASIGNVKDDGEVPRVTSQMMSLSRLALQCDLTRVVTFQWQGAQSPINYSRINDPILSGVRNNSHHGISHDGPFEDITKICKWHSAQVAKVCADLDAIQESDGRSLLDNTLILYCNELSDGERHSFDNLPFVLIGATGKLASGSHIDFSGRSNNDLFTTLLKLYGSDAASFGDMRYNSGELSGLLA